MGSDQMDKDVITVAIAEDTDVVVEGVRSWINADPVPRAVIVDVANNIEALLSGAGQHADVLVLDLELGKVMVTEQVGVLSDAGHRVVVYSVHSEPMVVESVLKAGACAFLDKRTERDQFLDTLLAVGHDRPVVTRSMAGGMLNRVRLSPREQEALLLLFQGMDHASIARRLLKTTGEPISGATVKQYIERARAKFVAAGRPCRSGYVLLARCIEEGLLRPEDIEDYRPRDI